MTGRELLELRRQRGVLDRQPSTNFYETRQKRRKVSSPNCPTGARSWSNISRCRTAARSRPMRIAPNSASCRASWPRPSNSWNWCSTTCRSASPPRTSRTAATSSPTARSNASRAFRAITSSASAPTRSSSPETAASIEAADRAALQSADGQFRNEFVVERGSREARSGHQPRDRAQREEPAGIPDRAVRRRHRPPVAVAGTGEHQEIPRTGGRQHSGLADRRARQRRPLSARQPQRRDHPQPPPRGCHRA